MNLSAWLGTRFPILQAPMAGVQDERLAIAVSDAGGLGALPCAMLAPDALAAALARIRSATGAPYNLNFFCHTPPAVDERAEAAWREALAPYYREFGLDPAQIESGPGRAPFSDALADLIEPFRPPVVSFHFGLPKPAQLRRIKRWGTKILSTATTVDEARWLEANGADAIIAQGIEAGGHRGMFLSTDLSTQMGTFALLPQIVAQVRLPVIAAGGIVDAAGVSAALALGAAGVQAGTAYLLSDEATTSTVHRQALTGEDHRFTALTNLFSGRPARGIVNRLMRELGPLSDRPPAFPLASAALAPLRAHAEQLGRDDFSPLWAGQNTTACRAISAARITRELAQMLALHAER